MRVYRLDEMAEVIDRRAPDDWWRFPAEEPVAGFMGPGQFIVGDQPSTSDWAYWNRNRRAFYDLLPQVGMADAHLTDLYKRRGKAGSLRTRIPEDFHEHLEFFRAELALLKPTRVIALGHLAYRLLKHYVPEIRPKLARIWHFAYVVRYNKVPLYKDNIKRSCASQG